MFKKLKQHRPDYLYRHETYGRDYAMAKIGTHVNSSHWTVANSPLATRLTSASALPICMQPCMLRSFQLEEDPRCWQTVLGESMLRQSQPDREGPANQTFHMRLRQHSIHNIFSTFEKHGPLKPLNGAALHGEGTSCALQARVWMEPASRMQQG